MDGAEYKIANELLKEKYLQEYSERKKLYNEMMGLKGNIRVFCRCRPLKEDEIENGSSSVFDCDSSQENDLHIILSDTSRKHFKFDRVFKPDDNQEAVFAQTLPLVTSVLDGYNVCIFAYGQTGSGKTYTMEGTPENRGLNYRTLQELFRVSKERSSVMKHELFVSMLEVYNEKIRDLLVHNSDQPQKKLEIKQSAGGIQDVPGLVEARVYSTDEVWALLNSGYQVRSVGSTNANESSSRSHCLLRVTIVGENLLNGQRMKSHLWLVDLAGSERVGRIEVEGDRLKESQFINKSLSALGDVISALASRSSHVPYRNSKLTHILQSSLGGDCKTLMLVQISPNLDDVGETLCSLNFATRVRAVEHGPARRQLDQGEFLKYKQLAEKAKQDEKERKKLQDSVQGLQLKLAAKEQICKNLQEKVRDLESQLAEERRTRLKLENRALASISAHTSTVSTSYQVSKNTNAKKPPLAPSKSRMPLRRITNSMPRPSPVPSDKARMPFLPVVNEDENRERSLMNENKVKELLKPRRGSIAARPAAASQFFQPRRRASMATLPPESGVNEEDKENRETALMNENKAKDILKPRRGSIVARPAAASQFFQPRRRASMATPQTQSVSNLASMATLVSNLAGPLLSSSVQPRTDCAMGRQSCVWDPEKVWKPSRIPSYLPRPAELSATAIEAAPAGHTSSKFLILKPRRGSMAVRPAPAPQFFQPKRRASMATLHPTTEDTTAGNTSSKFRGSPTSQAGFSWKPMHPTVVALQKKHFVWSPVKLKSMKKSKRN